MEKNGLCVLRKILRASWLVPKFCPISVSPVRSLFALLVFLCVKFSFNASDQLFIGIGKVAKKSSFRSLINLNIANRRTNTRSLWFADPTDANRERFSDFFYKHYLDVLILLLGTRVPDALERLQHVIGHFVHLQRLQLEYILTLDCSHAPFQPRQGMPFHTVRQVLASDPTKPSPNTDWHVL